jgi:predicted nucleic acid-binding protein
MATNYLLDSGPLGLLAHDRPVRRIPIQDWLTQEIANGSTIYISEVADYEVRRELLRLIRSGQLPPSRLHRLDQLPSLLVYLPLSTAMWRRAAELWAEARQLGAPSAGDAALDADALITAQALEVGGTVVTNNVAHIGRWVAVQPWPPA